MTGLHMAALASEALAASAAWVLTRRRAEHKPAALALTLLLCAHAANAPVNAALTPHSAAPWEGAARLLVYLQGALVLASVAIVPGLALAVFLSPGRRRCAVRLVLGTWALASIVLAVLYPSPIVRGPSLGRLYLAAELASLFIAIVALLQWARWAKGRASPGSAHAVAIALLVLDIGTLISPYAPRRLGTFPAPVEVIQIEIIGIFAAIAVCEVIVWSFSRR